MQRELAEQIIKAMKQAEQALGELDIALREIDERDPRRKQMMRVLIDCIHEFHVGITLPTIRDYPDLHPDFPDGSFRWSTPRK